MAATICSAATPPLPDIFTAMPWGTSRLLAETRARLAHVGVAWHELAPLRTVRHDRGRARGATLDLIPGRGPYWPTFRSTSWSRRWPGESSSTTTGAGTSRSPPSAGQLAAMEPGLRVPAPAPGSDRSGRPIRCRPPPRPPCSRRPKAVQRRAHRLPRRAARLRRPARSPGGIGLAPLGILAVVTHRARAKDSHVTTQSAQRAAALRRVRAGPPAERAVPRAGGADVEGSEAFTGESEGLASQAGELRCAAQACVNALAQAVQGGVDDLRAAGRQGGPGVRCNGRHRLARRPCEGGTGWSAPT